MNFTAVRLALDPHDGSSRLKGMRDAEAMALLKRVSRSFYLSVRLLPAPMRGGVCLGYLLARASDTLADAQKNPALLDAFEDRLRAGCHRSAGILPAADSLEAAEQAFPGNKDEQQLLAHLPAVFDLLDGLRKEEAELIREVVTTIIGGQRLDMQRFASAGAAHVVTLADAAELDDYMWRVAGSVGQFWTRLGFLTLGSRFSKINPSKLEDLGIRFGKGLQLVNILRDAHQDLAAGRGYLPTDRAEWMQVARKYLAAGLAYSAAMRLKRLHIAVALPARIGIDTLNTIEAAGPGALDRRIKIPRHRVWWHMAVACKSSLSRGSGSLTLAQRRKE